MPILDHDIVEFLEAVRIRYGRAEDHRVVWLSVMGSIAEVIRIIEYGSMEPHAIGALGSSLADVLIGAARLVSDRFPVPRDDMPTLSQSGMSWAIFALTSAPLFAIYDSRVPQVRTVAKQMTDMVKDTADDFGLSFEKIIEIAVKRVQV